MTSERSTKNVFGSQALEALRTVDRKGKDLQQLGTQLSVIQQHPESLTTQYPKFTTSLRDSNKHWRYSCRGKRRSTKFSLLILENVTFLSLLVHLQTKHKVVAYIAALNKSSGRLTEEPTGGKDESPAIIIFLSSETTTSTSATTSGPKIKEHSVRP